MSKLAIKVEDGIEAARQRQTNFSMPISGRQELKRPESPVEISYDLSLFERVDGGQYRNIPCRFTISARGDINLSNCIEHYQPGDRVTFYVQKTGRVIVIVQEENGKLLARAHNSQKGLKATAFAVTKSLQAKGITEFPAHFALEWSEKMGGYVGKLIEDAR